jgi:hypothetical protein
MKAAMFTTRRLRVIMGKVRVGMLSFIGIIATLLACAHTRVKEHPEVIHARA